MKDKSIIEIEGGLKALTTAASDQYDSNRCRMPPAFAASEHNLSMSVPEWTRHLEGWNDLWDSFVFKVTYTVLETVDEGMRQHVVGNTGLMALLAKVKKSSDV